MTVATTAERPKEAPAAPVAPEAPSVEAPDVGTLVVLRVEDVYVDPTANVSRHGRAADPHSSRIRGLARDLEVNGLAHLPTVVPVDAPGYEAPPSRPDGGEWTHRLVVGFRRWAALVHVLGWQEVPCSERTDLDRAGAEALNAAENFDREDPTDFDLASYFAYARKFEATVELAQRCNVPVREIEALAAIVDGCCPDLLEVFEQNASRPVRRALEKVCSIRGKDAADTRRLQLDAWARLTAGEEPRPEDVRPPRQTRPRQINRGKLDDLRAHLDAATEWYDGVSWRPIQDPEAKRIAEAVLRYVHDPKVGRPVR